MRDLIDRQETIKAIHNEYDEVINIDEPGKWVANDVEAILRQLPTAELENAPPAETKGKWIIDTDDSELINCSCCRRSRWSREPFELMVRGFKFCPNCGTRMEVSE